VPKSGGVGTISFYYKTYYSESGTFQVVTYESLGGEPTIIETIEAPANIPYTYYSKTVNDPDAQYVEIRLLVNPENWSSLYIDAITVTANGKGTPAAAAPEDIWLSAYNEETDTRSFDLQFEAVEEEIRLSLVNGADFSIDKTTITPVANGTTTETVTVTYTPSEFFSADSLLIESDGLLKPVFVPIYGNMLKDKLLQDFNKKDWVMYNEGNAVLDGWVITQGRRTTQYEMIEGDANTGGSLRLTAYNAKSGNIVSPAKSGGINTVEFYYRSQFNSYGNSMSFVTETSVDGQIWTKVDEVELLVGDEYQPVKHLYSKEVKDKNAKYFRILANLPVGSSEMATGWLFVDSIAIDALPYLRRAGDVLDVETTAVPVNIPVNVAGLLNSAATIALETSESAGYFSLEKTEITPDDVAEENIASFNVIFNGQDAVSGEYTVNVIISNTDDEINLNIPVTVVYTKPYLEVVNTIAPLETLTVPVTIPVEIRGLLNTDANITLDAGTNYTLGKTSLTPAELADGAVVSFDVTFTATVADTYNDAVIISNTDIEELRIPLSVKLNGTGINAVSNSVSVYLSKDGALNILGASTGAKVTVINAQGQPLFNAQINSNKERFDVSLQTGVYIVKVGDKAWKVKK
jgi:hypothetical protein